ncbi:TetR family transcriptional regulator [Arachnia rubra]|uniref:TetR family transcriptional regulator n=1 Tax=Arachnia rubra TaxID=1547448 RepID=A0ABX7Y7L6_9ACTN|nr:TetR family transcriptional regulator [Arachnia rubra]QUC09209.1 TetR family transcriptional regulator [Arachnia rubra]BCR80672.1 putative transcriptional regulator, TetR family protein [Arachnia rubra]
MLTRGRIVEAGLRILDAWGLGDLTMRRVADELGVKAGALYYHMPNKQSLLAEIADVILTPVAVPRATDTGEWLRQWSHHLRDALLAHRDGAELVSSAAALGMGAVDVTLAARELLAGNGYPEPAATMATFLHFILGHVMAEQTRVQLATLGVLEGFDEHASRTDFSHGVELLVRGVTTSQQPEDFPSRSQ